MLLLNWAFGKKVAIERAQGCYHQCCPGLEAEAAQGRNSPVSAAIRGQYSPGADTNFPPGLGRAVDV